MSIKEQFPVDFSLWTSSDEVGAGNGVYQHRSIDRRRSLGLQGRWEAAVHVASPVFQPIAGSWQEISSTSGPHSSVLRWFKIGFKGASSSAEFVQIRIVMIVDQSA